MADRPAGRAAALSIAPGLGLVATGTPLEDANTLLWVITGIAVAGSIITFAFLVYAFLKFRDPATKGRRYG